MPVRLWINSACLIVPRAMSRNAAFAMAAGRSADAGWPVHARDSGGSTVVHRPGILNVSLFFEGPAEGLAVDAVYGRLTGLLVDAFASLGVAADVGAVPGSYCDGRFNIRIDGRKIAGTACRVRRTTRRAAVLAHAVISVEGDPAADVTAVAGFERSLGLPAAYRADRHCTLEQAVAGQQAVTGEQAMARGVSRPAR